MRVAGNREEPNSRIKWCKSLRYAKPIHSHVLPFPFSKSKDDELQKMHFKKEIIIFALKNSILKQTTRFYSQKFWEVDVWHHCNRSPLDVYFWCLCPEVWFSILNLPNPKSNQECWRVLVLGRIWLGAFLPPLFRGGPFSERLSFWIFLRLPPPKAKAAVVLKRQLFPSTFFAHFFFAHFFFAHF